MKISKLVLVAGPSGSSGGLQTHHQELKKYVSEELGCDLLAVDVDTKDGTPSWSYFVSGELREKSNKCSKKIIAWLGVYKALKKLKPDIIISSANGFGYAALPIFAKRGSKSVKLEVTNDWSRWNFVRNISNFTYDIACVQSPGLLSSQRNLVIQTKKIITAPCFSKSGEKYLIKNRSNRISSQIKLCYFGRLAPNKGVSNFLLNVSDLILRENIQIDFWGSGVSKASIESVISEKKLKNNVFMKGAYGDDSNYFSLIQEYDGLILPSQYNEGVPLVLLEAASMGIPFYSHNVGAINDCSLDNPDCVISDPTGDDIKNNFSVFVKKLRNNEFNCDRLRAWHSKNHSKSAINLYWERIVNE